MEKLLILGKNGQVGSAIEKLLRLQRGVELVLAGRAECDLADAAEIRELIRRLKPNVVVNAAAYTAVDQAEAERDLCFQINAAAPRVLAEETAKLDALFIHYSSDYVFDGRKPDPYQETDPIQPLGVYGASKAAGDEAVLNSPGRHLILRTSWVYSADGKNFLRTMLGLQAKPELKIVDDQIGGPTSARAIAAATLAILEQDSVRPQSYGLYHMTAAGSTSWFGFAQAIFDGTGPTHPRLIAIPTSEYPTAAARPKNSVLSNDKFASAFGFRLPPWRDELGEVLAEMSARKKI